MLFCSSVCIRHKKPNVVPAQPPETTAFTSEASLAAQIKKRGLEFPEARAALVKRYPCLWSLACLHLVVFGN